MLTQPYPTFPVSTHSRPKAAAYQKCPDNSRTHSFNTQPPEGGCSLLENSLKIRQLEATFR